MLAAGPIIEALIIVTALCVDTFVSGMAYGANKIRIPFSSVAVISLICSAVLGVSIFLGGAIGHMLPENLTVGICFALLSGLGFVKLFDSAVKSYIRKYSAFRKRIRFSAFSLSFILSVYANPETADSDHSRILSPSEAALLAAALSLDGLAVGFGAGMVSVSPVMVVALSLIINMVCAVAGCRLGHRAVKALRVDLGWLSGALLLVIAFMKLF